MRAVRGLYTHLPHQCHRRERGCKDEPRDCSSKDADDYLGRTKGLNQPQSICDPYESTLGKRSLPSLRGPWNWSEKNGVFRTSKGTPKVWWKSRENVVRMTQEKDMLNRQGYKLTEQRQWVLNLLKSERRHWNALDIHTALQRKKQQVSLATIYRTLDLLVKLNLARKVNVVNRPSVFESNGNRVENREHFHLVCRECGRVIDVRPSGLSVLLEMEKALRKQHHFEITNLQITFSGSCASCEEQ